MTGRDADAIVVFRCDASPTIGYGHLERCIAIAQSLRDRHSWHALFAMRHNPRAEALIAENKFGIIIGEPASAIENGEWLKQIVRNRATALVLDVRDDLPIACLHQLRAEGYLICTIDDPSDRRLAANMAFYPPVPQLKSIDWTGFNGDLLIGWEWVIVKKEFVEARAKRKSLAMEKTNFCVLVTMGGSDPAQLTIATLQAIDTMPLPIKVRVVIGPGFCNEEALTLFLSKSSRSYDIHRNVSSMADIMAESHIAIASFGVTAYELAVMGVPSIHLCLTADHELSASALANTGAAINLGMHRDVSSKDIAVATESLFSNQKRRLAMSGAALALFDGLGSDRIADRIQLAAKKTQT